MVLINLNTMDDKQFLDFRNSLTVLHGLGVMCVIFPKEEENRITTAIWQRFHDHGSKTLYLSNIQIIFI